MQMEKQASRLKQFDLGWTLEAQGCTGSTHPCISRVFKGQTVVVGHEKKENGGIINSTVFLLHFNLTAFHRIKRRIVCYNAHPCTAG